MSELNNCCGTTCDKQKLAAEINALKNALLHIAKVCAQSRTKTRRYAWIIQRANSAVNGNDNWKTIDLPKATTEESQLSLRHKNAALKEQIKQLKAHVADMSEFCLTSGEVAEIKAQAFKQGLDSCIDAAIDLGFVDNCAETCKKIRYRAKAG